MAVVAAVVVVILVVARVESEQCDGLSMERSAHSFSTSSAPTMRQPKRSWMLCRTHGLCFALSIAKMNLEGLHSQAPGVKSVEFSRAATSAVVTQLILRGLSSSIDCMCPGMPRD